MGVILPHSLTLCKIKLLQILRIFILFDKHCRQNLLDIISRQCYGIYMKNSAAGICLIILKGLIWILGIYMMARIFSVPGRPVSAEAVIDDRYMEHTPPLYPGDTFSQSFHFSCGTLESIAIAFSYSTEPDEESRLLIQIYRNEELLIEQPLPLSACPNESFLDLNPGAEDFSDSVLTLKVTNISEDPESVFSLAATTDSARYSAYTEHYEINGSPQSGSIFCRFRYSTYRTDYDLYQKITAMFLTFLAALILSGAVSRIGSRWQQRIPRSHG